MSLLDTVTEAVEREKQAKFAIHETQHMGTVVQAKTGGLLHKDQNQQSQPTVGTPQSAPTPANSQTPTQATSPAVPSATTNSQN